MRDQIRDDLAAFTNPGEFGVDAVIATSSGSVSVTGIPDAIADTERMAATSQSGRSAFSVGAADSSITKLQFLTHWHLLSGVKPEDVLTIEDGDFAGDYRIKQILRDGDMALLRMNNA
jgi:hypothetical protein